MSPATTRQSEPDQACADAVDLARAAAEQDAGPDQVGEHVGFQVESDRVITHLFTCLSPAYVGWRWAVTVTRASRARQVTVNETVLLPGPDSMLAPDWVPWTERVRPGDLKAGDLMPAGPDDPRLVPVVAIAGQAGLLDWEDTDSWRLGPEQVEAATGETPHQARSTGESAGLDTTVGEDAVLEAVPDEETAQTPAAGESTAGESKAGARRRSRRRSPSVPSRQASVRLLRPSRVLSAEGRDETAARWYAGEQGPKSPLTTAAPANCMTCGFMVRLSGPLGRVFGVCSNEFAPDDGKVVSVDHGCGAHSEGETPPDTGLDTAAPTVDELGYDMLNTGATVPDSVLETLDHEQL